MKPKPEPIDCRWTRGRLASMTGTEAEPREDRTVAAHLARCAGCRDHLESLRGALAVLELAAAESPVDPRSPSLWPALQARIAAAEAEIETGRTRRTVPLAVRGAPGLAAAAAILAAMIAGPALRSWRADSEARIAAAKTPLPAPAARVDPLEIVGDEPPEAAVNDDSLAQNTPRPNPRPPGRSADAAQRYNFDLERGVPMPRGAQTGATY